MAWELRVLWIRSHTLSPLSDSAEPKKLKRPVSVCSRSSDISSESLDATVEVSLFVPCWRIICINKLSRCWKGEVGGEGEGDSPGRGNKRVNSTQKIRKEGVSCTVLGGCRKNGPGGPGNEGSSFAYRGNSHSQGPSVGEVGMKRIVRLPFCKSPVLRLSAPLPPRPHGCPDGLAGAVLSIVEAATKRNNSSIDGLQMTWAWFYVFFFLNFIMAWK